MISKEIKPICDELKKVQHLKTVQGQYKSYMESSHEPVRCWENHGKSIETLMDTVVGGMAASQLKKAINDSTIGKLNKYLEILRTYIEEELDPKHSGAEIIQDRLTFAASNYKPLKQLRDAWANEVGTWMQQVASLKRAYEREVQAVRAAEATQAARVGPLTRGLLIGSASRAPGKNEGPHTRSFYGCFHTWICLLGWRVTPRAAGRGEAPRER